jgi:hypothetical protein
MSVGTGAFWIAAYVPSLILWYSLTYLGRCFQMGCDLYSAIPLQRRQRESRPDGMLDLLWRRRHLLDICILHDPRDTRTLARRGKILPSLIIVLHPTHISDLQINMMMELELPTRQWKNYQIDSAQFKEGGEFYIAAEKEKGKGDGHFEHAESDASV